MKKIALLFLILMASVSFLFYLSPYYLMKYPDVFYVGDSLCEAAHDSEGPHLSYFASIARDCKGGRKSIEFGSLPKGKRIIFYALGSNDAGSTPIDIYKNDLLKKLSESDAKAIYCVLPNSQDNRYVDVRKAMKEVCKNTIEPTEHGYFFSAKDGIHGTAEDHRKFGTWLKSFIEHLENKK